MGRRCALLMSVPRQKLDSGVFDVFLLPQVKREPHTAVEHRLNNITNLLSCFCSRSPLMMQHHFPPLTSLLLCKDLLLRESVVSQLCELQQCSCWCICSSWTLGLSFSEVSHYALYTICFFFFRGLNLVVR